MMKISLTKKIAVLLLAVVMIAAAGIAMAESVETHTQTEQAIVNGVPGNLVAYPHNLRDDPEAQEFSSKYLGSLSDEELNEKYAFTLVADESFEVVKNNLYFGSEVRVPSINIHPINKDAEGKSVKIIMSSKETGEALHVMEYVFALKAERSVFDIQCSGDYTHEFISGMGEVLTVAEGSDLTISIDHKGVDGEALNMSYDWVNSTNDELIGTGNTFSLTDISTPYSFLCAAKNGTAMLEMIFFEVGVVPGAEETVETRTETRTTIVNGTVDTLFAHPHNKMLPETQEFDAKYLGSLSNEELDAKYVFTVEADESFKIAWSDLKYTDGAFHVPAIGVQAVSANAKGKSVKIIMSLRETGEAVHVMEYVYDLKAERSVFDIQSTDPYTHEFVSGMGEVLTVVEGSDLTISIGHKGVDGEALNMSYDWVNSTNDELIGTGNTFSLTDISTPYSFLCAAKNGTAMLEMIFFEVGVVPKPAEPVAPVWNGFNVISNGKLELDVLEDGTPVVRVQKGDQVSVTANYEYSGSEYQAIYWNFNNGDGWQSLESKTNDCTFTFAEEGRLGFTLNDNGVVLDEVIVFEEIPSEPTTATYTKQVMVGSMTNSGISPFMDGNVRGKFIIDYDGNGTITVDELNENITVDFELGKGLTKRNYTAFEAYTSTDGHAGISDPWFTFSATEQAAGEKITATVSNTKGDTFEIVFTIELMGAARKMPTVDTASGAILTARSDGDYDLVVKEGTSVTLTANYELLSGGKPDMTYEWYVFDTDTGEYWPEGQTSKSESYTFTAASELDGKVIELYCSTDDRLSWDNVWFYVTVQSANEPTKPTLSMTVETKPAAVDGKITVTEGDTVAITAKPVCSDPSIQIGFEWRLEEFGDQFVSNLLDCKDDTYTFTATNDHNGKYITVIATVPNDLDPKPEIVGDTGYSFEIVVQPKPAEAVTETFTWPILLNGAGSNSSRINLGDNEYLSEHFHSKYNHNELTMEYSAGKGITVVEASLSRIKFEATKEANGEFLTVTLTNPAGETYIGKYQFMVDAIYKGVTVNAASGAVLTEKGTAFYELTVKEGTTLTVTTNYEQLNGQKADMTYAWELARTPLNNAGNSYTFTVGKEHAGAVLTIFAQSKKNSQCLNQDIIEIVLESAEPIIKVEYEEGIPKDAITETAKEEIAKTLTQNSTVTKEEIKEKGIVAVIEETMEETVVEKAQEIFKDETSDEPVEIPEEQTAVYEVTLMYTNDGGKTWEKADEEHWPESGKLTVVLPYPEETDQYTTKFVVAHMFTQTTDDHKAGDIEYPAVTNTPDGIQFQVSGLSPIALAWTYEPIYATFYNSYEHGLPAETVTAELKGAGLNSVALIKAKLETELMAKALTAGKKLDSKQIAMTNVTLKLSEDGGKNWQDISMKDWNSDTVFVYLPYPEGTSGDTHDFMVVHMFATGKLAGQIEYLDYETDEYGLIVETTSLSPFAVAYFEKPAVVPSTGDSATPIVWMLGMLIAGAGCAAMLLKRRKHG